MILIFLTHKERIKTRTSKELKPCFDVIGSLFDIRISFIFLLNLSPKFASLNFIAEKEFRGYHIHSRLSCFSRVEREKKLFHSSIIDLFALPPPSNLSIWAEWQPNYEIGGCMCAPTIRLTSQARLGMGTFNHFKIGILRH